MKHILIAALAVLFVTPAFARGGGHYGGGHHSSYRASTGTGAKAAHEHVSGYTTKRGTQAKDYDRSMRDSTKRNNWSTKGNVNPETGKAGTK